MIIAQDQEVEIDTLLECSRKIEEVETVEPWIICLKEGLKIMITAEKEQQLSLENYKRLFSLYEKVSIGFSMVLFFHRWAMKFMKRFPNPIFDR